MDSVFKMLKDTLVEMYFGEDGSYYVVKFVKDFGEDILFYKVEKDGKDGLIAIRKEDIFLLKSDTGYLKRIKNFITEGNTALIPNIKGRTAFEALANYAKKEDLLIEAEIYDYNPIIIGKITSHINDALEISEIDAEGDFQGKSYFNFGSIKEMFCIFREKLY